MGILSTNVLLLHEKHVHEYLRRIFLQKCVQKYQLGPMNISPEYLGGIYFLLNIFIEYICRIFLGKCDQKKNIYNLHICLAYSCRIFITYKYYLCHKYFEGIIALNIFHRKVNWSVMNIYVVYLP